GQDANSPQASYGWPAGCSPSRGGVGLPCGGWSDVCAFSVRQPACEGFWRSSATAFRITSGHRLDETGQVGAKGLIRFSGALASPPGLRMRPETSSGSWFFPVSSSSLQPAVMVGRETPVAWETKVVPPYPRVSASAAT